MSENGSDVCFGGFLGHNGYGSKVEYKEFQPLYICDVADFSFGQDDCAAIGAGYPQLRKIIYEYLKERNVSMPNVIDPTCIFYPYTEIGKANIFSVRTTLSSEVVIGNGNVGCGHDVVIGDINFFGPGVQIGGSVIVGNENQIGTSSVLLPKSKIGNNNKIASLSAVYKGCKDNCYMLGNPALKVGETI
ncbi:MAG: hypothetical protein LBL16_00410 [Endomicrobium sp.]|jgi:acetyltransferase-like isoleucine patch superfamily enzyme|nr:hypothetical protein [Endomicrobium sp.]